MLENLSIEKIVNDIKISLANDCDFDNVYKLLNSIIKMENQHKEKELEYINEIAELNQELDTNMILMQQATDKINELNTMLALETTAKSKSKPYMSEKKAKALEARVEELEDCISLFSSQDLESKENELDEYLKIIIKLKNELKELKNENNGDIEDYKLEDSLNKCQSEISGKYMNLKSMVLKLKQTENSEITVDYINNTVADIINITSAMKSVIFSLYKQITDKNREIQSLREDITSNNSNLTKQELLEIIDEKEKIISAYADKIQGLEHELKNQK